MWMFDKCELRVSKKADQCVSWGSFWLYYTLVTFYSLHFIPSFFLSLFSSHSCPVSPLYTCISLWLYFLSQFLCFSLFSFARCVSLLHLRWMCHNFNLSLFHSSFLTPAAPFPLSLSLHLSLPFICCLSPFYLSLLSLPPSLSPSLSPFLCLIYQVKWLTETS